jgi:hypothetical protein
MRSASLVNFIMISLTTPRTSLRKTQLQKKIDSFSPWISPAGGLFRSKQTIKEVTIKTV